MLHDGEDLLEDGFVVFGLAEDGNEDGGEEGDGGEGVAPDHRLARPEHRRGRGGLQQVHQAGATRGGKNVMGGGRMSRYLECHVRAFSLVWVQQECYQASVRDKFCSELQKEKQLMPCLTAPLPSEPVRPVCDARLEGMRRGGPEHRPATAAASPLVPSV